MIHSPQRLFFIAKWQQECQMADVQRPAARHYILRPTGRHHNPQPPTAAVKPANLPAGRPVNLKNPASLNPDRIAGFPLGF